MGFDPRGAPSDTALPFVPQMLEGMDWDTLNSLAYKFQGESEVVQEPLQLAAGGASFNSQRAINELDQEGRPPPKEVVAPWSRGKDDPISKGVKERNSERGREEQVRLLMGRGVPRERAEKMVGPR